MPVYFNFFFHIEDFLRKEESSYVVERIVEIFEKYRVKPDLYFTGLNAQNLAETNQRVIKKIRELGIPISYHGDVHAPFPTPAARIFDLNWDDAVKEVLRIETHKLDPLTGEVDPEKVGGWEAIRQIFGSPPITTMVVAGAAPGPKNTGESAPWTYAHKLLGARIRSADHAMLGFPLYWHLGLLRGGPVGANSVILEGPSMHIIEVLKHLVENFPKDKMNVISMSRHDFDFYEPPNVHWSMIYHREVKNPKELIKPPTVSKEEIERRLEDFEKIVAFVAGNSNMNVVTCEDILSLVVPLEEETTLDKEVIAEAADFLVHNWLGIGPPPPYIQLKTRDFSLSDAFQAFLHSLAEFSRRGTLPARVKIREILGPVDTPLILGLPFLPGPITPLSRTTHRARIVTEKDVLETAALVNESFSDRVPGVIRMLPDRREVNSAAFLYVMAQEFRSIFHKGEPKSVLLTNAEVVPQAITSEEAESRTLTAKISNPDWLNLLQLWTLKPARIKEKVRMKK